MRTQPIMLVVCDQCGRTEQLKLHRNKHSGEWHTHEATPRLERRGWSVQGDKDLCDLCTAVVESHNIARYGGTPKHYRSGFCEGCIHLQRRTAQDDSCKFPYHHSSIDEIPVTPLDARMEVSEMMVMAASARGRCKYREENSS